MDATVKRPLNELPATEIAGTIAAGETTCVSVVRDCIARIEARDDVVKAWVNFKPELALAQAHALAAAGLVNILNSAGAGGLGQPFQIVLAVDVIGEPDEFRVALLGDDDR